MENVENVEQKAICSDCKGIAFIGGAEPYDCLFQAEAWLKFSAEEKQQIVEERLEIECDKFDPAPRDLRIKMKEMVEIGITKVHGNGRVQIPVEIRDILQIQDGDDILWIRKGFTEFTFRKAGYKGIFKPQYR